MKKVLLSHSLLYIAISVFIGYFIGYDIENDFFDLYAGKLLLLPVRYTLLLLIVAVSNLLGNVFMNSAIVVREKNFLNVFLECLKYEICVYAFIYIGLNIPVFVMNFEVAVTYFWDIFMMILNAIVISVICSSVIRFIDLHVKNRMMASCGFLIIFSIVDLVLDHFNFYIFKKNIFDLSYIFALPVVYNNYFVIAGFLVLFGFFLVFVIARLACRKDYFLRNENT